MSDYSKIAFSSAFRYERIAIKSSTPFSLTASQVKTITIPHNLGYRPYVRAKYTFGGKYFDLFSGPGSFNIDGNNAQCDSENADTVNYVVTFETNGTAVSGTIYYRIYAEPQV